MLPAKILQRSKASYDLENATPTFEMLVPIKPIIKTGFLPALSEVQPHQTAESACAAVKAPWREPTWTEMLFGVELVLNDSKCLYIQACKLAIWKKSTTRTEVIMAS